MNEAAAASDGSEMPRPAASALISIFQPLPACSTPPMMLSIGMKTSLRALAKVGPKAVLLVVGETVFLGALVLGAIFLLGKPAGV